MSWYLSFKESSEKCNKQIDQKANFRQKHQKYPIYTNYGKTKQIITIKINNNFRKNSHTINIKI